MTAVMCLEQYGGLAVAHGLEGSRSFDRELGLTGITVAYSGAAAVKLQLQTCGHSRYVQGITKHANEE